MQAAMATWAAKDLPARLDVATTAKLRGFAEHYIQILMAVGKLTPLGDPARGGPRLPAQGHKEDFQILAAQACAASDWQLKNWLKK